MTSMIFLGYSIIYLLILLILYFSKKRISLYENTIYSTSIIVATVGTIIEIITAVLFMNNYDINSKIYMGLTRFVFIYYISWINLFVMYMLLITNKEEKHYDITANIGTFETISIVLLAFLPFKYSSEGNMIYTTGLATNYMYIYIAASLVVILFNILKNSTKLKFKKIIPFILLIILGGVTIYFQSNHPELFLITPLIAVITFVTYFTIENPDIQMLKELELAKNKAEKASKAKTDFLKNISHEIRTPLNTIIGFGDDLSQSKLEKEDKEKISYISKASNNLLDIVNNILDISKIEENKIDKFNKEYDIYLILRELTFITNNNIGDKNISFNFAIDESIPRKLYGNPEKIKKSILNVLQNSIDYTKEGFIDFNIACITKDDMCRLIFSVEDSGVGIETKNISKILNPDQETSLAETKRIIDEMDGKIVVQSIYGKGTRFTISFDQKIVETSTEEEYINANQARVLIVEDDELNIKVANTFLKKYNLIIESVKNGQECLDKIKHGEVYDIIFLDDMMPVMDGKETLVNLKNIPSFNTPVIALTANAIKGMKEEYLSLGFDDYLSKPIKKSELQKIIKKYLKTTSYLDMSITNQNNE